MLEIKTVTFVKIKPPIFPTLNRLQSVALAHRSEYIPYCLCKTFINITVTFVKITVTINFVAVLVYDPKIFGPCSIHAQKFKDRGPDFGLLFTERYDYPWLFDRTVKWSYAKILDLLSIFRPSNKVFLKTDAKDLCI